MCCEVKKVKHCWFRGQTWHGELQNSTYPLLGQCQTPLLVLGTQGPAGVLCAGPGQGLDQLWAVHVSGQDTDISKDPLLALPLPQSSVSQKVAAPLAQVPDRRNRAELQSSDKWSWVSHWDLETIYHSNTTWWKLNNIPGKSTADAALVPHMHLLNLPQH